MSKFIWVKGKFLTVEPLQMTSMNVCNIWSLQVVGLLCGFIETKSISGEEKILDPMQK